MEPETTMTEQVIEAMQFQIHHTKKQIESLNKALNHVSDASELQVKGILLKTYSHKIKGHPKSITLPDYRTSGNELTIRLDPKKTIMKNADAYFHRYHRDKHGLETIQNNLKQAQQNLENQIARQKAFDPDDLEKLPIIRQQLIDEGALKTKVLHSSKAPEPAHPRRFYTTDHVLVEVGKNSVQNDHLTLTAKKDYYWMHVSELAGSHVVIHSTDPSEQCLLEAASLTAYYSKGRGLKQVPVDVVRVRQLHKPKGAKPGLVMFTGKADILTVYPDGEMAKRLAEKEEF